MTSLWFVTPVYRRFYLTKVCLEQRRRMIDRLPFEANCVVIGDDENLDVARELGFPTVEWGNEFVGAKFNAGYRYAVEHGASHCMPIGSDSWLHESVFEDQVPVENKAMGLVGLSSFAPDGTQRVDLQIHYPAGFGVGMIYPAFAVAAKHLGGNAADPNLQRGIDNSTWARVGRGKVQIDFQDPKIYVYINFHSTEDSITDFRLLSRSQNRVRQQERVEPFGPLRPLYDADLIEQMETYYALRSLQVFLTGEKPVFFNPHQRRRRYPNLENRQTTGGIKQAGVASRYPNVGERGRAAAKTEAEAREYAQIDERRSRKARGLPLTRDEEISLRFADQRGL